MPIDPHDPWSSPYKVIDDLFEISLSRCSGDVRGALSTLKDVDHLEVSLRDKSFVDSIPYLSNETASTLQSGQLCRYRGLVQDMYGAEMYAGAIGDIDRTGISRKARISKYRDVQRTDYPDLLRHQEDGYQNDCYMDRSSFLLVPIPGQTSWIRGEETKKCERIDGSRGCNPSNTESRKRSALELSDNSNESLNMTGQEPDNRQDECKRKTVNGINQANKSTGNTSNDEGKTSDDENENDYEDESPYEAPEDGSDTTSMFENMVKHCPGVYNLEKEICCLLKMYDMYGKSFRLNDVIEVVGIYTDDTRNNGSKSNSNSNSNSKSESKSKSRLQSGHKLGPEDSEDLYVEDEEGVYRDKDNNMFMDLPADRIPACVHCISYRRLGSSYPFFHPVHVPDFCDCSTEESIIESTKQSMALWGDQVVLDTVTDQSEIIAVKEWVLNRITKALCGDCLAAEYVLLSMLSRTYSRDETGGNLLLGSLPINLNGLAVGDKRINDLKDVLTALVPSCVKISADIRTLNGIEMMPVKNSEDNRLSVSPLQLARGTVLIIDESGLTEGTLLETGNRSLAALKSVVTHQKLPISLPYCELSLPTDYPIIMVTPPLSGVPLCGGPAVLRVVLSPLSVNASPLFHTSSNPSASASSSSSSSTVVDAMDEGYRCSVDGADEDEDDEMYEEWVVKVRMWWARVRLLDVTMCDDVAAQGIESFAQARQSDLRLAQSDFHQWLTVSRLIAISEGAREITAEHWGKMRTLESIRVDRTHPHSA